MFSRYPQKILFIFLILCIANANALSASISDNFMVAKIGSNEISIQRSDVLSSPVSVITDGTKANLYFCIRQEVFDHILLSIGNNATKSIKVRFGNGKFIDIRVKDLKSNCQIWGPINRVAASRMKIYLSEASDDLNFFPKPAATSTRSCPESLFVKICLNSRNPLKKLSELSALGDVKFEKISDVEIFITPEGARGPIARLSQSVTRFEDIKIHACTIYTVGVPKAELSCDINFPLVNAALPNNGKRIEYVFAGAKKYHQEWILENGTEKNFVSSSVQEDGTFAHFNSKRIEIRGEVD